MKYCQLDQITSLVRDQSITATRTLRSDEEHLLDHFPNFPVMPGVMMLESLHQAAIWLIRASDGFVTPLVLLREVKGVKFGEFLAPNETLHIEAKVVKSEGSRTTIKATAQKDGKTTVTARMILETSVTGDPERVRTDSDVLERVRKQFVELFQSPTFDAESYLPAAVPS
ncbi:MAG: beta-hydroxyacyl-ACP dehydratase [Planctomycetota bacterium]